MARMIRQFAAKKNLFVYIADPFVYLEPWYYLRKDVMYDRSTKRRKERSLLSINKAMDINEVNKLQTIERKSMESTVDNSQLKMLQFNDASTNDKISSIKHCCCSINCNGWTVLLVNRIHIALMHCCIWFHIKVCRISIVNFQFDAWTFSSNHLCLFNV